MRKHKVVVFYSQRPIPILKKSRGVEVLRISKTKSGVELEEIPADLEIVDCGGCRSKGGGTNEEG